VGGFNGIGFFLVVGKFLYELQDYGDIFRTCERAALTDSGVQADLRESQGELQRLEEPF
jgi:hypothetical protein